MDVSSGWTTTLLNCEAEFRNFLFRLKNKEDKNSSQLDYDDESNKKKKNPFSFAAKYVVLRMFFNTNYLKLEKDSLRGTLFQCIFQKA